MSDNEREGRTHPPSVGIPVAGGLDNLTRTDFPFRCGECGAYYAVKPAPAILTPEEPAQPQPPTVGPLPPPPTEDLSDDHA